MREAFQKDVKFLADVRQAIASRRSRLWWLGQSGFMVVHRGSALLLDPYLSDSLTRKYAGTDKPHTRIAERVIDPATLGNLGNIQAITSSHNHTDHLDAETLIPLLDLNPNARLIIPAANRDFVVERLGNQFSPRLVLVNDGGAVKVGDITFHGIASAHNTIERDALGQCKFLGYAIQWDGLSIYHSGDTLWHDRLAQALLPLSVQTALLPINGDRPERRVAGNLDGAQAAQLAKDIRVGMAIPCHYDMFEFNTVSPDEFVTECNRLGQPCRVLRNGEGFDL